MALQALHGGEGGVDPVRQLIWAGDGRSVSDVLIAGRVVVRDRRCIAVDVDALRAEAVARRDALLARVDKSLT